MSSHRQTIANTPATARRPHNSHYVLGDDSSRLNEGCTSPDNRQVLVDFVNSRKVQAHPGGSMTYREMATPPLSPQFAMHFNEPSQFQYPPPLLTARCTREKGMVTTPPRTFAGNGGITQREQSTAFPFPMEWRPQRVKPNQIFLQEIVEDESEDQKQVKALGTVSPQGKGIIRPVADSVVDAITVAREQAWNAREQFLDWIWKGDEYETLRMPPCPPCYVVCGCVQPVRIKPIDDCDCDCGRPGYRCQDCCGLLPVCPHCGRRMPLQSRCSLSYASPCFASLCPPKPTPLPELVVTSMGPFRDKLYIEERPPCSKCIAGLGLSDACINLAYDCGRLVGSQFTTCQREPPPIPVPGRPIQRLLPCFFPPPPLKKKKIFPLSLFQEAEPIYRPPKGGFAGVIEDCYAVGMGATGVALDCVAETLNASICGAQHLPGAIHCNCDSPLLRYPKNGIYSDPPIPPTKATGCRFLDAFNNFMDAVTFSPSKPEDVELVKEGEIPETEKTGNKVIDTINETLDQMFPPPKKIGSSDPAKHHPLQALMTYLTNYPKEPAKTHLLPCLAPEKDGLNCLERHLPTICFGENLEFTGPRCGPEELDYVNFTLLPSNVAEGPTSMVPPNGTKGKTVMPVPYA